MATYHLLEPGKGGVGLGWNSLTSEGEDLAALKALHAPPVTSLSKEACSSESFVPDYYGQIVQAVSGAPPVLSLVSVSAVDGEGNVVWYDLP